ncbi:MAG: hypothetical protein KDL87_18095 [Verrucomicrobiae bacterium]|nr:hypothetical protein [Verrucomicrobiae bacterium]
MNPPQVDIHPLRKERSAIRGVAAAFFGLSLFLLASCASSTKSDIEKKPYFGHEASQGVGNFYVPKEVRRTEPWFNLF